jgi:hypothetical protein
MKKIKTIKKNNLDSLLENVLLEDNPAPAPTNIHSFSQPEAPKNASLDQAVDRYIVRYEKESIPTSETYENEIFENKKLNFKDILKEAFMNEADPTPEPSDLHAGATQNKVPGPDELPIMATPQINLQDFARNIARLINNFEQLLRPSDIILNRVVEYIKINYDEKTSKELIDILDKNYSLRTTEQSVADDNQWPTSYAIGSQSTES